MVRREGDADFPGPTAEQRARHKYLTTLSGERLRAQLSAWKALEWEPGFSFELNSNPALRALQAEMVLRGLLKAVEFTPEELETLAKLPRLDESLDE
ncbi:hypothetical protein FJZ40_04820 [Candidatus Shapirobacteria bacterium]|nr:hypothetical protein [Candidatus Shapirobacteria bacterium]